MPDIPDELLEIEKNFWTGDERYFAEHTDENCLVAFTEMAQLMDRKSLAATAGDGNRWRDLRMDVRGAVSPAEDILIMTYEASAVRANGEPYSAVVSTGYVKRPAGWKMMFHAHAPLTARR